MWSRSAHLGTGDRRWEGFSSVLTGVEGSGGFLFLAWLAREPRRSGNAVFYSVCSVGGMETKGKKKFVRKSGKAPRGKVPHGKRKFKKDNGKKAKAT